MIRSFEHKYSIGDEVFHITPDSDKGIILNISYSVRYDAVKYEVAFGRHEADCVWCLEDEIESTKSF